MLFFVALVLKIVGKLTKRMSEVMGLVKWRKVMMT